VNKANCFVEIWCVSGILGIVSKFLGSIEMSYIILLILLVIDTATGMAAAVKYRRFSSRGLCKFTKKAITYTTSIITVKLLEIGVVSLVKTDLLSHLMVAFLQITETISILENLTILGVPIPSNFIKVLINHLKIPGLENALKMSRSEDKNIDDIDEMIKYQLPAINNQHIRNLLEIKLDVWKTIAYQIQHTMQGEQNDQGELLYYKILFFVETGFQEIKERWKEEKIPSEYIDKFYKKHQPRVDRWLQKAKSICYSNETVQVKKQLVIDSLLVMLYQTVLDAHKN